MHSFLVFICFTLVGGVRLEYWLLTVLVCSKLPTVEENFGLRLVLFVKWSISENLLICLEHMLNY